MVEVTNGIETKVVEVPLTASVQDKILILSLWQRQLQSEGWNILSTRPYGDNAFVMEVRRLN
jgi:hypothetical protein